MYAVEFETVVNSPYIKLENYLQFINKKIKVIVLSDEKIEKSVENNSQSFFKTLRNRNLKLDKEIDINTIMNEMNNGLS